MMNLHPLTSKLADESSSSNPSKFPEFLTKLVLKIVRLDTWAVMIFLSGDTLLPSKFEATMVAVWALPTKTTGPKLSEMLQFLICNVLRSPGNDITESNGSPSWKPEHLEMLFSWSIIAEELAVMLMFVPCAVHWQMVMVDIRAWCSTGWLFFQWRPTMLTSQNWTFNEKSTSTSCLFGLLKKNCGNYVSFF